MRKSTFLILIASIFCLSFTTIKPRSNENPKQAPPIPSAGLFLFSPNLTIGAGSSADHINEVKIETEQAGMTVPFSLGSGGSSTTGKPSLSDFAFVKQFDLSTLKIKKAFLLGQQNDFEIRYYNGTTSSPVYSVKITHGVITSFSESSEDCSGGCPLSTESFSIAVGNSVMWTYSNNGNPQSLIYDVANNTVN